MEEHNQVVLKFSKSTSKNYSIAVERARELTGYSEEQEGKDLIHNITFDFHEIKKLKPVLDIVGQWKSSMLYVNGKQVPYKEIYYVMNCYLNRLESYRPDEYCFGLDDTYDSNDNDFGCRNCGVEYYDYNGLDGYGHIKKDGTFVVDKDRLKHDVLKNLERYALCPALDIKSIKKKIDEFPSEINPKKNNDWEYFTDWQEGKEVAVSVRKIWKSKKNKPTYVVKDHSRDNSDEILINLDFKNNNSKNSKKTGCLGCLIPIGLIIILTSIMLF